MGRLQFDIISGDMSQYVWHGDGACEEACPTNKAIKKLVFHQEDLHYSQDFHVNSCKNNSNNNQYKDSLGCAHQSVCTFHMWIYLSRQQAKKMANVGACEYDGPTYFPGFYFLYSYVYFRHLPWQTLTRAS